MQGRTSVVAGWWTWCWGSRDTDEPNRRLVLLSLGRCLLDQTSVEVPPGLLLSLLGLLPGLHLCLPGSLLLLSRTLHLHNRRSAREDHHDTEP